MEIKILWNGIEVDGVLYTAHYQKSISSQVIKVTITPIEIPYGSKYFKEVNRAMAEFESHCRRFEPRTSLLKEALNCYWRWRLLKGEQKDAQDNNKSRERI